MQVGDTAVPWETILLQVIVASTLPYSPPVSPFHTIHHHGRFPRNTPFLYVQNT